MRLTDLIETFKGHDKVIFKLTGVGEMEYNTVEFKDAIDTIEALQQENEQLQARVARVREVLRKAREALVERIVECIDALELCTHNELCKIAVSPYDIIRDAKEALAEIDKAIGGKEDV